MRKLSELTQELALALEVASIAQAWGNPSPFQDKINELLVKAGRKPVAPNKSVLRDRPATSANRSADTPRSESHGNKSYSHK